MIMDGNLGSLLKHIEAETETTVQREEGAVVDSESEQDSRRMRLAIYLPKFDWK